MRPSPCHLLILLAAASPAPAQRPPACGADTVVNIYRHVLDLEPPESPALAVLTATPAHSRSATAPKPVALAAATVVHGGGPARAAIALDASPYFLAGGGARSLCAYRDNGVRGRLQRVGIKTIVSVGALPLGGPDDAVRVAAAVRATLHDPHDPINNSDLVRQLPAAPAGDEQAPPGGGGAAAYEAVARAMRARDRWIVSAGYGAAATFPRAALGRADGGWRHVLWLSWQRTLDARFDLLFTGEGSWRRGAVPGYRVASAARRKHGAADLLLELAFDTGDERLHGGLVAEARLAPGLRGTLGVLTEPSAEGAGHARALRLGAMVRWTAGH